jgi:hypothetical protein
VALAQAQPQVVVLRALHRLVVAAQRAHGLGAHHHGAVHDAVADAQPAAQRTAVGRRIEHADLDAVRVDAARARSHERRARLVVEERDLPGQTLGRAQIVRVHARHVRGAREREPAVE